MCSCPDRAVRVRALAGDAVLCSWLRHVTLTVPLSTQEYKWVPANCWGNLANWEGVTGDGLASHPQGVEILLAASCYGNRDKLRPDGMLVHRRVTPSIKFAGTHLYTWVERGTVRVKCLAQEHNTMSPARVIMLCSWARYSLHLGVQMGTIKFNAGG